MILAKIMEEFIDEIRTRSTGVSSGGGRILGLQMFTMRLFHLNKEKYMLITKRFDLEEMEGQQQIEGKN
jgi:hypothetical protein